MISDFSMVDYAEQKFYDQNCFRENAIHAAHGAMTDDALSDLNTIGQGSAWNLLRGLWNFLEPKIGRGRAEDFMYATIQVINFLSPALKSASDGYAERGRLFSDDTRISLVAYHIERMKFGFLSGELRRNPKDILYDILEIELGLLNERALNFRGVK
jgi:hypothetical protein